MNFAISEDHRLKIKESKKKDKYLVFARELKKKTKNTTKHEGDGDAD